MNNNRAAYWPLTPIQWKVAMLFSPRHNMLSRKFHATARAIRRKGVTVTLPARPGLALRSLNIFQNKNVLGVLLAGLALTLILGTTGCGKKGNPMPDYSRQLFSWRNVFASMSDAGCLSVSGSVAGSTENLAGMVLELQPLNTGDGNCEACPFVPQETFRVTASDAWESPDGDTFRFAYCPAAHATAYRWRLAGRNVFTSLPPVLTPVRVVDALDARADPVTNLNDVSGAMLKKMPGNAPGRDTPANHTDTSLPQ